MKITNSDLIKSGERELIDTIIGDLDWGIIKKIVKDHHKLSIEDDVAYRQGDIIVQDGKVAYQLDFEVKMRLSVVFDRDGNYLSLAASDEGETDVPAAALPAETDEIAEALTQSESDVDVVDVVIGDDDIPEGPTQEALPAVDPEKAPKENFSAMASHIADMISDINED
ncbi:MAG: hypothetical protein JRH15_03895 [Deltaproteobacteria bacterium]|nr:hypothetical protein [Deltaproteobacteria bacterium]